MKIARIIVLVIGVSFFATLAYFTYTKIKSIDKTSVSYNGWLKVEGADIINSHNKPAQLIGVSTHGIQWDEDNLYNKETIAHLKSDLSINVFRIALYTNPEQKGYIKNPELKEKVYELVDACIELDIYAVIDWHILADNNPYTYEDEARDFFSEVSERYKESPNVIYEICNEPNGEVSWEKNIYPYANNVISDIRKHSEKGLIIVGTPVWSTDLTSTARKPLADKNVAYALHFYAGSHNITLRDEIDYFREKGLAVFVTECGATDSTGDGDINEEAFTRWTDFMKERHISWIYWSYSNMSESSAMLQKGVVPSFEDDKTLDEYLSPSGQLFKKNSTRDEK